MPKTAGKDAPLRNQVEAAPVRFRTTHVSRRGAFETVEHLEYFQDHDRSDPMSSGEALEPGESSDGGSPAG
jgi:hypothetical protein